MQTILNLKRTNVLNVERLINLQVKDNNKVVVTILKTVFNLPERLSFLV